MHHPIRSGPHRGRGPLARLAAACAVLLGLGAAAVPAAAQTGEIAGTVVDAQERPVAGAQVAVQGQTRSAVTDVAGRFRLAGVQGTQVTLQVDRIGYARATRTVPVGQTEVRITLRETVLALDAVVVTGVPGAAERRTLGNAIAVIDAAEVVRTQPVGNLQELLNARSPGVVVIPASGNLGTGSRIRVRGVSSLSLAQEPLVYVDGVRVNNDAATGPINQGFGSNSISRFNDIDPADIESIEIIRGPAAATLYGTEAVNGVVQIITKRGSAGATRFDLSVRQGSVWFANPEGRLWTNYGRHPGTGEVLSIDIVELENQRGNPIWQTGHLQKYSLSVSGGSPTARYYVGGSVDRDEGIEPQNTIRRWNGRANLTVEPRSDLEVRVSTGYVEGRTRLPLESGGGGLAWSAYFSNPLNDTTFAGGAPNPRRGHHSATPEAYQHAYDIWQDVGRFTGSIEATHRPTLWLSHRLALGLDVTRENNVELVQRIDDPAMAFFFGLSTIQGLREEMTRHVQFGTVDYSATASRSLSASLSSATTLGSQIYRRNLEWLLAQGNDFPVRGLTSVSAASVRRSSGDAEESVTVGVFAQQQFSWRNRVFLTGALRADDHSAFGEEFDLVYYPKLSASWVVSEEPFWRLPAVDALKLRAAYGHTGQAPATFAALRTFRVVTGPGDASTVTPDEIGNPALGPERGKELELGFEGSAFGNRLGIDFTFYDQRVVDALLRRQVAPSGGFSALQWINASEVTNRGVEVMLRGVAVRRRNVELDLGLTVATNRNRIASLGVEDLPFVQAGGFVRHVEGYPAGSWFERRLVGAEFDSLGIMRPGSALCDDGAGGAVPCADAPHLFLGRPTPSREGAFVPTLTLFERLRISALVDFKQGYHKLDGNLRVRCVLFRRCHENWYPQEYLHDPAWLAQTQSSDFVSGLIHDASFTRFRELSATYTAPSEWARRFGASRASLTLAGRNLWTWTRYPGLEPEASFLGGSRGGGSAQWEQNVNPQVQQFVTTLNLSF
jgi:TonB-dependent SusC/RagA subfamily outer membrane receptor